MQPVFKPGKITVVLDGGAGSSAKGSRGAYVWKHFKQDHTKSAVNTFMENAAHTIIHDDGREFVHQCLSSITSLNDYEEQYLSPGCVFATRTFLNEIDKYHFNPDKIKIHPNCAIVSDTDVDYEKGLVDFDGNKKQNRDCINLKIGSTLHGVGSSRARRLLRREDAIIAKDISGLESYLINTQEKIINRLINGESILGEIAQGWQLSLYSKFWPKTTSRNCSVAAFLDDSMLPPWTVGPIILNYRSFPIRVNSNKYTNKKTGEILTWDKWQQTPEMDREIIKGDSGGCYNDQEEITWEEISKQCGEDITKDPAILTSLSKLPRRVYTFSKENLFESMIYNNTGDDIYLSINFMNFVDSAVKGKRTPKEVITPKVISWLIKNIFTTEFRKMCETYKIKFSGLFLGTWKNIDDSVFLSVDNLEKLGLLNHR